jgi:intein/homing endonuclease
MAQTARSLKSQPQQKLRIPFNYWPRDYQLPFWQWMDKAEEEKRIRRAVLIEHRRAGKDKTCLNFMTRETFKRRGIYFYFLPTYSQARKVVWDGIDRDGFKFLDHIPESIRENTNSTEMKILLKNGSLVQFIGSDSIDNVVGTNPVGCVFSEYALQDPTGWDLVRPILRENGGWAVFAYCVAPDTLVLTENGLRRIENLYPSAPNGFSELNQNIYGLGGFHKATHLYKSSKNTVLKLKTAFGYEITGTPHHPIWTGTEWKQLKDWKICERVPVQRGMQIWGNGELEYESKCSHRKPQTFRVDETTAYILGLWLAEGSCAQGNTVITTSRNDDIDAILTEYGFRCYDNIHYILSDKQFVQFIDWFGMGRGAKNKRLPDKLFGLPKVHIAAFLRGYFDGDGCATKRGTIHCDSVSEGLINDIQTLLLNFGIVSCKRVIHTKPTAKVKVFSTCYRLEIVGYNAHLFWEQIGFKLQRKQKRKELLKQASKDGYGDCFFWPSPEMRDEYAVGLNCGDIKRHDAITYRLLGKVLAKKDHPVLRKAYEDQFFYDRIVSIDECTSETLDFVIPDTHSFFSNGFVSHNTPRGMNHGYTLYEMARNNPEWFSHLLTVEDTGLMTREDVEDEIRQGMDRDLAEQEFFCSFQAAIRGAYFGEQLKAARAEGRILKLAHQPGVPIDTWWDLGYDDSMSIWFSQDVGREVHFLYYLEGSGEGLAYYARELDRLKNRNKDWYYGRHTAPHDIEVHELGTGKSRKDAAREMGLYFETCPRVKLKEESIEAARNIFPICWFDEIGCKRGLDGLASYSKDWDEKNQVFRNRPKHDWAAHCGDSYQTFAMSHRFRSSGLSGRKWIPNRLRRLF